MVRDDDFVLVLNLNSNFFSKLPSNFLLQEFSCVDAEAEGSFFVRVSPFFPTLPKRDRSTNFITGKPSKLFVDSGVLLKRFREVLFSVPGFQFVVYLPVGGRDVLPSLVKDAVFGLGVFFSCELLSSRLRVGDLQRMVDDTNKEILKVGSSEELSQQLADQTFERIRESARGIGLLSSKKDDEVDD